MSEPFKGTINVDIRDSVPDWAPFEPPKAPDGAPTACRLTATPRPLPPSPRSPTSPTPPSRSSRPEPCTGARARCGARYRRNARAP